MLERANIRGQCPTKVDLLGLGLDDVCNLT